ncbi:hypothetical protein [Chitinophaga sp. LS1]|uniref:hypothetical protein n=1 Tax=Chitinophaga sp. LS1 TaxID=3051176 RepID=UPI002AABFE4E|nr:hypothetical protein [Chitinophaga sp. LS1]WPV67792.1 hypothetical protein QQL36_03505 [Chitinophaga sp. LS1]
MLPRGDEYNVAIQNPRIAFTDTDLKNGSVETTPLGLPKPYSGGSTITYKLSNHQGAWAVRCFHRDMQDLQRRYQSIGNFLSKSPSSYFVDARYLSEGIKINGKGYPIIKMSWLEGEPLNIYLDKAYNQRAKVERLLSDFVQLISELERFGIAHGDLQHGNILVKNDKLHLIDYDGMYFPELASLRTNEIGHINYQHPGRSALHYNQYIDRFSAIVIYIGLKAISLKPSLWSKYENGENILFRSQDYADLQQSALIQDLLSIPEIKTLVERLIGCCYLDIGQVPSLQDFLSGNFSYNKSSVGTINITRSQYEIIDAAKKGSLLEHFGEKIEVVGKISGKYLGSTSLGAPYMFLNFGPFPHQTFTLVIWQEGIATLTAKGMSPVSLVGKYVSVTGVITSYNGNPQMIIEQPTQIQILANEGEVNQRLRQQPIGTAVPTPPQPRRVIDKEADVFNSLYKDKTVYTPPKPIVTPPPKPVATQPATTYKPPATTYSSASSTNNSNNNGCIVPIIFAFLGLIVFGAASEGKLWFIGVIVGGFVGAWVQSWFKS